jgi:ElaB/YqjD/DUF883 family membrane-anchored ribosome-binding protein
MIEGHVTSDKLDGIEVLRVVAAGNLAITGIAASPLRVGSREEPEVRRTAATAEIRFAGDAELGIPPGVAVEVVECAGHLEVEDFNGNLTLNRVAGHFSASNVGPVAIRGSIEGRCDIEGAGAIAGKCVKGDLLVEKARSVSFDLVAGNAVCIEIAGDAAIEQIGGHCRFEEIEGEARVLTVGGKFEAERARSLKVDTVGGKLRVTRVTAGVTIGNVGGKASIDGAGDVAIANVGGQLSLRSITGNVTVERVGGAARLGGDFAPGSNWTVRTAGRMLVELGSASSVTLEAAAHHGRVRVYGIEGELRFAGRDRLSARFGAGECKLALETRGSDIIVEGDRVRGHAGARFRWRDIGAPFESLAENLGDEIPDMVADIVGAAGRIVAETGSFSGGLVRGVTRGVGEAMREVEREIGDLKHEVPEQAADKLAKLGAQIRDLVNQALAERRSRSKADAEQIRARIREEAHRMRDAIREARRARAASRTDRFHDDATASSQPHSSDPPEPNPAATADAHPDSPDPSGATRRLEPDKEILKILASVRAGEIDPEEADDLIRALMEVERAERGSAA